MVGGRDMSQIPKSQIQSLAEILHEDVWENLHPATKLIVKILQHIRSKVNDFAEVRAFFDDEILITTHKSEIRIDKSQISFKRWGWGELRIQRAKIELSDELFDIVKKQILDMLENDAEPDYGFIVEVFEKTLSSSRKLL